MTFKVGEHEEKIFVELRRIHLRHPGMVVRKVANLLKLDELSQAQIDMARQEWLRLGGKP